MTGTVLCALGLVLFGSGIAAGGKDYIANTDLNSYNGSTSTKDDGSHAVLKKTKIDSFSNLNVDFKHIDLAVKESEDDNFYLSYNVETTKGIVPVSWQVDNGTLNLADYSRMNEFLNAFDLLKEYNVAKGDPLGADYDEMAIDLADGKTAFWFNGNWAWPNLEEAGAETTDAYGFLPYFMNNDPDDFVNSKIQASPSKQIMMDNIVATDNQKAAAKEFLNWLVYSEIGQQMVVKTCSLIPPFKNNPNEPSDPLSCDIYEKVQNGEAFNASAIVPNDHWSVLGAAMQKYLAGRSDREELMDSIQEYWDEQK